MSRAEAYRTLLVLAPTALLAVARTTAAATAVTTIAFSAPFLGASDRLIVSPYTSSGVTFTAVPTGGFTDAVVGVVKNQATSACVEPASRDQKLGTGRRAFAPGGAIGLGGFPIRARFHSTLLPTVAPVFVSVQFQTGARVGVRLRLLDPSSVTVASITVPAMPVDGTCGYPGEPRARRVVTATSTRPVRFAIMDVPSGGRVFVIDNFRYGLGTGP